VAISDSLIGVSICLKILCVQLLNDLCWVAISDSLIGVSICLKILCVLNTHIFELNGFLGARKVCA